MGLFNLMKWRLKRRSYWYLQISDKIRKRGLKLEHGKFRLHIRKILVTIRVIQGRNRLSREALPVEVFRT